MSAPAGPDGGSRAEPLTTVVIVAVFVLATQGWLWLEQLGLELPSKGSGARTVVIYLFWTVPTLVTLLVLYRFDLRRMLLDLGLRADAWRGIATAFLCTLPMAIGYLVVTRSARLNGSIVLEESLFPGVFEEYVFRGFLVGQLFMPGRLGFLPAVLISAATFALGHIHQGGTVVESLEIALIVSLGSGWFAWLFIEWGRNLYLIMALHAFMNLWWSVFGAGETALGGVAANLFRFATVLLAIAVTIRRARKRGFEIGRRDWLSAPRRPPASPAAVAP